MLQFRPPTRAPLLLLLLWGRPAPLPAQGAALPRETGQFILHKFERPIGREEYSLTLRQDGLALADTFEFTDRGTTVPLGTTASFGEDLSPHRLVQRGRDSRHSTMDLAVDVLGDSARIRMDSLRTTVPVTGPTFAIAGYAPIAMQQLLIRYWERHDRPDTVSGLPHGRIAIDRRGLDSVSVQGRVVPLTRYVVA
ncbi:MAG TPA: hypothetical protein VNH46_06690, partial [Gemmatimonadales bacterium]|nr:hypothetical protein [Gemmatimonadales bacterium]